MARSKNSIIHQYLNEVSSVIVCPKGTKRFFLGELEQAIFAYAEETGPVTLETLYGQFGAPERYMTHLADDQLVAKLFKKAKRKARIWMWIGIIAVAIAVIAILFFLHLYDAVGGTFTVSDAHNSR